MRNISKNMVFRAVLFTALFILCGTFTIKPTFSFLTAKGNAMDNKFTIALDPATHIIEYFPNSSPNMSGKTISYAKAVQAVNTGYIDAYVRVRMDISNSDVKEMTAISSDGNTFYSWDDYVNHLPDGWVYNQSDGYFYYTKCLAAGNRKEIPNAVYSPATNEYLMTTDRLNSGKRYTTPLIKAVKTVFASTRDIQSYSLNVYSESIPYYLDESDYSRAWKAYFAQ